MAQGYNRIELMIILRYLSKQILLMTAAITFILLVVAVLGRFLKYLAQASLGELDPSVLALLMSYRLPEFIQLILPLALLLGILLAYGRMYADSEMTVLIACGLSRRRLLGITLVSSTFIAMMVAILTLKLTPWGQVNTAALLEAQKELTEFDIIVPGLFQNISRGQRTTYSEDIVDDEMQNVFMHESENNRVTMARTAIPSEDEEGRRYILFLDGSLSEGVSGQEQYTVTQFDEFGIRLPQREINFDIVVEEKAMTTAELLASDEASHIAEFQWRLSLIILIPILTLFAVPLSKVSPRQGRFARLLPALLIYIIYFGLLLGSRNMIGRGSLSPMLGLWWVHVLFLGLGLILFFEKLQNLMDWTKTEKKIGSEKSGPV